MDKKIGQISASMMCADLLHLKDVISLFEKTKIEYLHIDVMDGEFVPNLGLGVDYVNRLREMTNIPMDIHMMVTRPEDKLKWLNIQPNDSISIHYESTVQVQRTLEKAKEFNCKVMLAINPATPLYAVNETLDYIDGITVLTVNPGFAGQEIVASCIKKTEKLANLLKEEGYPHLDIQVDGNISFQNAKILRNHGANLFVAGTSSIFQNGFSDMEGNIGRLREAIV